MNKKTAGLLVVVILLVAAIGGGTYLAMNRQTFFSSAQQVSPQGNSCPAPGTPATVTVTFPLCE